MDSSSTGSEEVDSVCTNEDTEVGTSEGVPVDDFNSPYGRGRSL